MDGGYYGGKNAETGLRNKKFGYQTSLLTTELLGAMIGWMSGDRSKASEVVKAGFEPMMRTVEHIDCYPEICILEKYGRMGGVDSPSPSNVPSTSTKQGFWSSLLG